ncbi:MAG: hypothetical protein NVS3B18_07980 [Candidatus Dormibacteria bacterium]
MTWAKLRAAAFDLVSTFSTVVSDGEVVQLKTITRDVSGNLTWVVTTRRVAAMHY